MDNIGNRFIGRTLAERYHIIDIVGKGGMAVVYKARDLKYGNTVAIKILKDEYLDNEEFCRRFRNESRAIAMLNHPNIVRILDVCNSPSLQYIVMEYVDGISLSEYIAQQKVLKVAEAVHFTTQILKALMYAHSKGVVHRDIKPLNIMLLSDGRIKVLDFGIARMTTGQTATVSETAIGSVYYIAPEQVRGQAVDARADVYSVGVMLYQMLTGKLPFEGDNVASVVAKHFAADPVMPRRINPNIPVGLEEIIIQAMQKNAEHRYQSAQQMLSDLQKFKVNPGVRFGYRYVTGEGLRLQSASSEEAAAKKSQDEEESVKSPVVPIITGIASAFVLVAVVFVLIFCDASGIFKQNEAEQIEMPDLVGQVYNEVLESNKYGFDFYKTEEFSSTVEEGVIIEQLPKAGKTVYSNAQVTLVVSKGPERLLVPEYSNMTYSEYTQTLTQMGLSYIEMPVYDDDIPEDIVCNTNPQPNEEVTEGDVIEVYYSLGPKTETIVMSNFVNTQYASAKSQLNSLGITVDDATYVDSEKPEGTIISQTPSYGTELSADTVVKFTVSNGNAPETTVKLDIALPSSNSDVNIEIYQDGESVKAAKISLASESTYSVSLTGSGNQTVDVYINGQLYQTYTVYFDSETYEKIQEYALTL